MNKPIKPNITIPESFAKNGVKTDFDSDLIAEGFDNLKPDVLAGDNLNKFIDDTYKGLNYGMAAADAINLINEGETLTVVDGKLTSRTTGSGLELCDTDIVIRDDEKMFTQLKAMKHSTFDLSKYTVDGTEVFSGNKTGIDTIKADNYEVVGSPVISNDGVAIFDTSSALSTGVLGLDGTKDWDIYFDFNNTGKETIPISTVGTGKYYLQIGCGRSNGVLLQIGNATGSTWGYNSQWIGNVLSTGLNKVHYKYKASESKYFIYINDMLKFSVVNANTVNNNYNMLIGNATALHMPVTQGFDLNSLKVYQEGNLIYQPCLKIPYTQSKTGSKIVDVAYRDRVIDLYEQEGQAGYYTIDEENKNFTLPMGEIYGMIEGKATYQPPLLSTMWSDHLLNDMSYLRADTFSWQDGNTYWLAYNELLAEYNNSASVEKTEGDITFKHTPKGYKIALASQETAVLNKYNSDGIAWYYILDTTNKKFKLPRAKHPSLVTLTSTAPVSIRGNGKGLTLTNGSSTFTFASTYNSRGDNGSLYGVNGTNVALSDRNQGDFRGGVIGVGTNPDTSGLVGTADLSSNVKDYNMYLYFYVGAFTKSAEAQTAGLKAELLNGKQDVCIHIIDTYVNGTSGYRIWSDGYCEQWGTISTSGKNTITFVKTFKDTNYYFNCLMAGDDTNEDAYCDQTRYDLRTQTEITVYKSVNTITCWKASGYIK